MAVECDVKDSSGCVTQIVVGFVEEVVLVWIQLQCDTVLLVPDRSRRCGIIHQLYPLVLGQTRFDLWKDCEIHFPCRITHFVPQSLVHDRTIFGHFLRKQFFLLTCFSYVFGPQFVEVT